MKRSTFYKWSIKLFLVSSLMLQKDNALAQLPLSELNSKQEFQATIQQNYVWNSSEKNLYQTIISQPRFSIGGEGTTFNIDNPDHLRALKDRLEVLQTHKILRPVDFLGVGENIGLDPCLLSWPNNTYSKFNRVSINYNLGPVFSLPDANGVLPEVFSINTNTACGNNNSVVMYVNDHKEIGFGTSIPASTYHFATPNFQVGTTNSIMFKIDNSNNTISFNKPGMRLFQVDNNGKLFAREFEIISNIPVPDYVFAKGYKLMPLDEVEQFITKYKHLPGIKSAAEYEKEGTVNVGELQMKLLEKIEELTLYTISLKKQIEKQQEEIIKLTATTKNN